MLEKVDNIKEQMSNVSREIESLRENQNVMLEIGMKNTFDRLIGRLDITKERNEF